MPPCPVKPLLKWQGTSRTYTAGCIHYEFSETCILANKPWLEFTWKQKVVCVCVCLLLLLLLFLIFDTWAEGRCLFKLTKNTHLPKGRGRGFSLAFLFYFFLLFLAKPFPIQQTLHRQRDGAIFQATRRRQKYLSWLTEQLSLKVSTQHPLLTSWQPWQC